MTPSEPGPEEIIRREERGFVAALRLMTAQARTRWPGLRDFLEIHHLIFEEANSGMAGQYRRDTFYPAYIRFPVPPWKDVPGCMVQLDKLLHRAKSVSTP